MFEKELQQLGLSDKETKTYLVSLELGPTSVQEIAQKAQLKRPTTYFAIEQLIKKGLMSSFEKGKKRYFSAESPERLVSLIAAQRRKAQALEEDLQRVLPQLNEIFALTGERPRVRFFEGKEGIKAIQEDIIKTKSPSMEEFVPRDPAEKLFPPHPQDHRHRIRKVHKNIRTIYTSKRGAVLPEREGTATRRFIPPQKFPFAAEIVIYGNKVAFASMEGKVMGTVIESEKISKTMRSFFDLAWEAAGRYQK